MTGLAFACAGEPRADWVARVERLAWSLRALGGSAADAPFHACFAGRVPGELLEPLQALDVTVHEVEPFDARLSYANKLRILELGSAFDAGVDAVVMIDCDVVVAGDPAPHLPIASPGAKPADMDPLGPADWGALCSALGMPLPPRDVLASSTGRPMHRYYNSGVVVVPCDRLAAMQDAWARWLYRVVDMLAQDDRLVPRARRIFADQYALMAAMAELGGEPLGVAANCPTHLPLHARAVGAGEPALLHYHARAWPSGLLQRPVAPAARPAAARFNTAWARARDLPYAGLQDPPLRDRVEGARARVEDAVRSSRAFTRARAAVAGSRADRVA
ncbi:hypothetical protein LRS13_23030 [Svornostia abyssi]|uniref:Glycosyltransferase n=1 Tax=Svornostia abyssi TaxID=2898438 RepID=A0ABY5PFP3_9ACTN|nr:hypothetical protein LRS13_23030 [Parviterribacteraceae bacterium J379]